MAKKEYNIYNNDGSLRNWALNGISVYDSTGALRTIREGDFVFGTDGIRYPILRFDTLPFNMRAVGGNMLATYLANQKTLTQQPIVVGMGSSTMFGHGLNSPNRYWDKVTTWFNANTISPTLYNIAVEGINSASMQLTTAGGTTGQNLTTAFTYNPTIIIWDEPTNWAISYDENQQIAYWLAAFNACFSRGILLIFNSARPRGSLTNAQQLRLKAFNTLLSKHPVLKYVSNIDGDTFWDTATTYALKSIYDQGDATHLTSAGTTILANDTVSILQKAFIPTTAYSNVEIHYSGDGVTYVLSDTITDMVNFQKSYTGILAGYYKSRGTLKDGSFTSFGTAVQVTGNASPTANAGGNQTVTLPTSTAVLSGSGSDPDGTISSYAWTQISGPNTATLSNANTATLTASNLIAGSYVFRLTVTDNLGATGINDATITVNSASIVAKFNFNRTAQSTANWVDVSGQPHLAQIDSSTYPGTTIFIRTKPTNASAVNIWGNTAGDSANNNIGPIPSPVDSGVFPNSVLISGMFTTGQSYSAGSEQIEIRGLTPGGSYTINAIGSRIASAVATAVRYMEWRCVDSVGTTSILNYDVKGNSTLLATFSNKIADGSGVIKIAINRPTPTDANYNFGYIMGLTVQ